MNTRMNFSFYNPTRILFGAGELNTLYKQTMPGKKALLLISNGKSTEVNGSLDRTIEQLEKAGIEYAIFDKIMETRTKASSWKEPLLPKKIPAILFWLSEEVPYSMHQSQ